MPQRSAGWVSKALAVYAKDLRLELRSRYALNAILMFAITTLAVVSFSLGQSGLSAKLLAALFWVVIFFSAMSGLAQVFIREEESGTALALRLLADPDPVFIGKLLFNFSLLAIMTLIVTPLFFIFTDAPTEHALTFIPVLALGVIGLSGATTLVAAIISRASVKGALFAVLSFPILMPLLMALVAATETVFDGGNLWAVASELQFLTAYAVVMITASIMLFKFVWQD
ncbi:MAG: heme exporter protein CcmB [candidate division Zixibacteria bacterium]|nr:heme exporter protein CcmB [candidate division Zixibacteria bacterium]MDH3936914.1 heme exporter protein CcmB [candidate division Zixibacteria bacterium]MDH4033355.1 heme exporter protein CcmB [candidate division Zixibacteria bacterium]